MVFVTGYYTQGTLSQKGGFYAMTGDGAWFYSADGKAGSYVPAAEMLKEFSETLGKFESTKK